MAPPLCDFGNKQCHLFVPSKPLGDPCNSPEAASQIGCAITGKQRMVENNWRGLASDLDRVRWSEVHPG